MQPKNLVAAPGGKHDPYVGKLKLSSLPTNLLQQRLHGLLKQRLRLKELRIAHDRLIAGQPRPPVLAEPTGPGVKVRQPAVVNPNLPPPG